MTDEDLREIEQRANAATPGPWRVKRRRVCFSPSNLDFRDVVLKPGEEDWSPGAEWCTDDDRREYGEPGKNAAFIAHARTDIPKLVAAYREKCAEIGRLHQISNYDEAILERERDEARAEVEKLHRESFDSAIKSDHLRNLLEGERDAARAALAEACEVIEAWVNADYDEAMTASMAILAKHGGGR